ncbi:MAG TPA: helix-turn-helix transcriptional regulator [Solirubrobacteraceae bacterium]|jgi:DNA-binding PadR family transcriptional regulator|nr:helix-turn-helix transcriptional regulator [Solirubrobacteraceae bacterium]
MRAERDPQSAPMQSQVNWALLGLVIERPSYAYELAQRFDRTYAGVLTLSSVSHAYTALAALRERELIEELPGTRQGRQPKPHYRATAKGLDGYGQWLVAQLDEDLRRQRLFILSLATFTRDPQTALELLARYEQACLEEARGTPIAPRTAQHTGVCAGGAPELAARLAAEESRLAVGAKLAWVEYARRELMALPGARVAAR